MRVERKSIENQFWLFDVELPIADVVDSRLPGCRQGTSYELWSLLLAADRVRSHRTHPITRQRDDEGVGIIEEAAC